MKNLLILILMSCSSFAALGEEPRCPRAIGFKHGGIRVLEEAQRTVPRFLTRLFKGKYDRKERFFRFKTKLLTALVNYSVTSGESFALPDTARKESSDFCSEKVTVGLKRYGPMAPEPEFLLNLTLLCDVSRSITYPKFHAGVMVVNCKVQEEDLPLD